MSAGKGDKPRPTNLKKFAQNYSQIDWGNRPIRVSALKCIDCGDIVYSRARHDFRSCSCGAVSVDGGFEYMKISGDFTKMVSLHNFLVDATQKQLYDDWNMRTDKFGLIRAEKLE